MARVRRRLIPLLAVSAAAWAGGAAAQASHRLAVEAAGVLQVVEDRMASPLRYAGWGVAAGVAYSGRAGGWVWDARAAVAAPRLTSRITSDVGGYEDTAWGAVSGELLGRLWNGSGASVWVGPGVATEMGVRRHVYTHDTWLNFRNAFLVLQAAARAEVALGPARLTETLAFPVVGLAVRKEYAGVIRRDPRVELAFPPFRAVRHRLTYDRPITRALGVRLFHEASLIRHDGPELDFLSHRVGAALVWRSRP